jgi:hypothetical protein
MQDDKNQVRKRVIQEMHDSSVGGHSGVLVKSHLTIQKDLR